MKRKRSFLLAIPLFVYSFVSGIRAGEWSCENPQDLHDCMTGCLTAAASVGCCLDNFSGAAQDHCLRDALCYWFPNNQLCAF